MRRIFTIPATALVVLVLSVAFLAASNHCSLSTLTTQHSAGHSCCKEKDGTGQPRNLLECCTSLPAPLPATLSAPVIDLFQLRLLWAVFSNVGETPAPVLSPVYAAVGPPALRSFAESILQRSLLAHAPPVFGV